MANISGELNNIKNALFGKDVRKSIHDGIDAINKEVESTTNKQVDLESTFDQLIINAGNSNAEIVDARVKEDGTSYAKLGDRLDDIDKDLIYVDDIVLNVRKYGAKGDGVVDDTQAIQRAINECPINGKVLIPKGVYNCNSLIINKVISFECYGQLNLNKEGVALLTIGAEDKVLEGLNVVAKTYKEYIDYSIQSIGIKIINIVSSNFELSAQNFTTNIELIGNNNGCVYNNITLNGIKNAKTNLKLTSIGEGWVNENKFFGGRFSWFNWNNEANKTHIHIEGNSMNQNIFFSPSLENEGEYWLKCEGRMNTFYSPRFEPSPNGGAGAKIYFGEESYSNNIMYPFFQYNFDSDKIVNLGRFNKFFGRYGTDWNGSSQINTMLKVKGNPASNPEISDAPLVCCNTNAIDDPAFIVRDAIDSRTTASINGRGNGKLNQLDIQNSSSSNNKVLNVKNTSGQDRFTVDGNGNMIATNSITTSKIELTSNQGIYFKSANGGNYRVVVTDEGQIQAIKV